MLVETSFNCSPSVAQITVPNYDDSQATHFERLQGHHNVSVSHVRMRKQ